MNQVATTFQFVQATPAITWTIAHGLGRYPVVDVYIDVAGVATRIMPASVTYVDVNTCTLGFSVARAGFATVA